MASTNFFATGCEGHCQKQLTRSTTRGRYVAYQDLSQVVVGNIGEFLAVELGDDKLCRSECRFRNGLGAERRTAWPRLRGLMSRKASVLSLSKSLKQGFRLEDKA